MVFYLTRTPEGAAQAQALEEAAQWVRRDVGAPEPKRSVNILDVATDESARAASSLIDEIMAAANYTSTTAPWFVINEMP